MQAKRDLIEEVLRALGVFNASAQRFSATVDDLLRDGITRAELTALVKKCRDADEPGGLAVRILSGDYRTDLARAIAQEGRQEAATSAETERVAREALEAQKRRCERWGLLRDLGERGYEHDLAQLAEHEHEERAFVLLRFDRLGLATAAKRLGLPEPEVLARAKRFAELIATTAPALTVDIDAHLRETDPAKIAENIARFERERKRRAKAATTEQVVEQEQPAPAPQLTVAKPWAQTSPLPANMAGPELDAARDRAKAFWARHEAQTDRAWCERFGDELKNIDPELWKRMMSGPEPEPWIRERVSRATNRAWRDVHESLRRQDSERAPRGRMRR